MSTIQTLISAYQFNRPRTLGLLDKIEQEKEPQKILGWRPGRAHIAWQLTHIGIGALRQFLGLRGLFHDGLIFAKTLYERLYVAERFGVLPILRRVRLHGRAGQQRHQLVVVRLD